MTILVQKWLTSTDTARETSQVGVDHTLDNRIPGCHGRSMTERAALVQRRYVDLLRVASAGC